MKKLSFFLLIAIVACNKHKVITDDFESNLKSNIENAGSDKEKITWLSRLAWYYMEIDRKKSDSVMRVVYALAEDSKDKTMPALSYLFDAQRRFYVEDYQSEVKIIGTLADKAYNQALSINNADYMAYSYLYMAHSKRLLGEMNDAEGFLSKAFDLVDNSKSDSLKLEFYYLRSQVRQDTRDLKGALQDALQVQQIAEKSEDDYLRMMSYHRLGNMYSDIDAQKSKENYKLFAQEAKKTGDQEMIISSNINLGLFFAKQNELKEEGKKYLDEAMGIARKINHKNLIASAHDALTKYYLRTGQPDSTVNYLNKNLPELENYYRQNGLAARLYFNYGYYYYLLGNYYRNNNQERNATTEFLSAVQQFGKSYNAHPSDIVTSELNNLYYYYGACNYYLYKLNKNYRYSDTSYDPQQTASAYFTNATRSFFNMQKLSKQLDNPEDMRNAFSWMEELYRDSAAYYDLSAQRGEFASYTPTNNYISLAYECRKVYDSCDQVLQDLTNRKEILVTEQQYQANMEQIKEERERQKENLKQIGITVALALVFVLLIFAGLFRVSEFTIRALGFFAFLFLFEFILLLIDSYIEKLTHGEVISLLAIKIVIAAILLPLHHFLEEKVIRSLTKRKLLKVDAAGA